MIGRRSRIRQGQAQHLRRGLGNSRFSLDPIERTAEVTTEELRENTTPAAGAGVSTEQARPSDASGLSLRRLNKLTKPTKRTSRTRSSTPLRFSVARM